MGHIQHYEFTDMRVGEYGVTYSAATEVELQAVADKQGYSGSFVTVVRAFPPCPPASVLRERAEREKYGYGEGEVRW